jgi:hypothetical protein
MVNGASVARCVGEVFVGRRISACAVGIQCAAEAGSSFGIADRNPGFELYPHLDEHFGLFLAVEKFRVDSDLRRPVV